jgi:hypothetical protein
LELVMPMEGSEASTVRHLDGMHIRTTTPGAWQPKEGKSGAACAISPDFLLADCHLGKGRAVLFADADLLDAQYWQATGVRRLGGSDDFANMEWVKRALLKLRG